MMWLFLVLLLLLPPVALQARLPHNIPTFCAGGTVVGNKQVLTLERQTIPCLRVERGGRVVLGDLADVKVGTLQVLEGGVFQGAHDGITARITILDQPLDPRLDPEQYGTGILALGTFRVKGMAKAPFVRLGEEPRAGQRTLTVARAPAGWRAGDRVFIPDTRQVPPDHWFNPNYALHHEMRTIAAIDGVKVVLDAPLSFDHAGAKDADGKPAVLSDGTRLLPHLANLTRSIVIESENPTGTRGHFLATHHAEVHIEGVAFQNMGRTKTAPLDSFPGPATNQIGRYPVHIHHVMGPANPTNTGYQFTLAGNVVENSLKWPIAIHSSHFGLIQGNVVVGGPQPTGAGIALEDGTETENLVRHNFVGDIRSHLNPRGSGPSTENGSTPGSAAECIWGAGFNNRFVGNVVTGCRNSFQGVASGVGFKFIVPPAPYTAFNPASRGDSRRVSVTPQRQNILEFSGNECYGVMSTCVTTWALGTNGYDVPATQPETVARDFVVWNTYDGAFWFYPTNKFTIENLTFRTDPAQPMQAAITAGDYRVADLTVRGGTVHAGHLLRNMTDPVGKWRIENVKVTSRGHALSFGTPATPGTRAARPAEGVAIHISNLRVMPWPGEPLRTIGLSHTTGQRGPNVAYPFILNVTDDQGVPGANFQVFFTVQATENLYGGLAPCAATRPEVEGLTCRTRPTR